MNNTSFFEEETEVYEYCTEKTALLVTSTVISVIAFVSVKFHKCINNMC
jgi:hypothetical protein